MTEQRLQKAGISVMAVLVGAAINLCIASAAFAADETKYAFGNSTSRTPISTIVSSETDESLASSSPIQADAETSPLVQETIDELRLSEAALAFSESGRQWSSSAITLNSYSGALALDETESSFKLVSPDGANLESVTAGEAFAIVYTGPGSPDDSFTLSFVVDSEEGTQAAILPCTAELPAGSAKTSDEDAVGDASEEQDTADGEQDGEDSSEKTGGDRGSGSSGELDGDAEVSNGSEDDLLAADSSSAPKETPIASSPSSPSGATASSDASNSADANSTENADSSSCTASSSSSASSDKASSSKSSAGSKTSSSSASSDSKASSKKSTSTKKTSAGNASKNSKSSSSASNKASKPSGSSRFGSHHANSTDSAGGHAKSGSSNGRAKSTAAKEHPKPGSASGTPKNTTRMTKGGADASSRSGMPGSRPSKSGSESSQSGGEKGPARDGFSSEATSSENKRGKRGSEDEGQDAAWIHERDASGNHDTPTFENNAGTDETSLEAQEEGDEANSDATAPLTILSSTIATIGLAGAAFRKIIR